MGKITFSSASINVSMSTIWNLLMEKISKPGLFNSETKNPKIVKDDGAQLIRKSSSPAGEVVEQITIDVNKAEVRFKLLKHPKFRGTVINRITKNPDTDYLLYTVIRDWTPISSDVTLKDAIDIKADVSKTKQLAELRE